MESPNWYKLLFWILGCILFAGLTIRDILPLIDQYHNNNIDVQMNVSPANGLVKPPNVSLYIPRSEKSLLNIAEKLRNSHKTGVWACVECDHLANRSWDVWSNLSSPENLTTDEYYDILSVALSKKLLIDGAADDFAVLSISNLHWNLPILDAAWDLVACLSKLDSFLNDATSWDWNQCWGKHNLDLAIATKKMDELIGRIFDIFCAYIHFRRSPAEKCKRIFETSLSVVYRNGFIFEVPMLPNGSEMEFKSDTDQGITWPAMDANLSFNVAEGLDPLAWPLTRIVNKVFISDPLITSGITLQKALLAYSIISTVADKRKGSNCYYESSPAVCRSNCMLKRIIDQCVCVPFTFRKHRPCLNRHLAYCNSTSYSNCPINKSEEEAECRSKCICPRQHTLYKWFSSKQVVLGEKKSIEFYINPSAPPSLVEFATVEKYTFEQFFSQMASVFNLYLGVSGLELISWSILFIEYVTKWYREKRGCGKKNVPRDNLEAIVQQLASSQNSMLEEIKRMKNQLEKCTKTIQ